VRLRLLKGCQGAPRPHRHRHVAGRVLDGVAQPVHSQDDVQALWHASQGHEATAPPGNDGQSLPGGQTQHRRHLRFAVGEGHRPGDQALDGVAPELSVGSQGVGANYPGEPFKTLTILLRLQDTQWLIGNAATLKPFSKTSSLCILTDLSFVNLNNSVI